MIAKLTTRIFAGALAVVTAGIAHGAVLSVETGPDALHVQADGKRIVSYVWNDTEISRPYFANLKTLDGLPVTRTHPPDPTRDAGNDDHATYHPGVWLAFGDLGGADFWRNKARVRHVRFSAGPSVADGELQFAVLNSYESQGDSPVVLCEEEARYTFRLVDDGYLLTCESVFKPAGNKIAFGDQEEMGFGVRLATPLTVKHGTGRLWNSAGGVNEAGTWGKVADWCAGDGTIDGRHVGVVVIPSPANFRPAWFHSRDYGLIVANPFGRKAMTGAEDKAIPEESTALVGDFTLRFGLGIFSVADNPEDAVARLLQAYTAEAGNR